MPQDAHDLSQPATTTTSVTFDAPPAPPRPRPRLYPIALLPLLPLIVIEIVCLAPQARYRSNGQVVPLGDAVGEYVGRPIGLTCFALLVAAVVFVAANRRSWAANLAFALVVLAACGLSWATAYFTSVGRALEITNRARTVISARIARVATAQQDLDEAGSISVARFDQQGELEERLALLERLRSEIAGALSAGDAAYDTLPGELARAGVFRRRRAEALADFQRDLNWPRASGSLKSATAMYDAAVALFRHLTETKETWSVTPGVNNIEFHTPEAKRRGDALRDALARAAQQALAAMKPDASSAPSAR